MCTLLLAWQVFPDAPLVAAANRDEFYDRRSSPPDHRDWERPVVAPQDGRAEGTWIGYNDEHLLAAITNKWTGREVEAARSRGLLVRDCLAHESAEAAIRFVERELDGREYDGFNLVLADESAAILLEYDGGRHVRTFEPGVHVVVNVGANGQYHIPPEREDVALEQASNADELLTAMQPEPGEDSETWLARSREAIADHAFGVCIHADDFGTRSSSLIRMTRSGVDYDYADGPPCETEYERVDESVP